MRSLSLWCVVARIVELPFAVLGQGFGESFLVLSDFCFQGIGMMADVTEAFHWLDMAARAANKKEAWAIWGTKLLEGLVCKRDVNKAKEMFLAGAAGAGGVKHSVLHRRLP